MSRSIIYILVTIFIFSCYSNTDTENKTGFEKQNYTLEELKEEKNFESHDDWVEAIFSYYTEKAKEDNPIWATSMGYEGYEGRWSDFSLDKVEDEEELLKELVTICNRVDEEKLSDYNKVYFRVLKQNLQSNTEYYKNELYFFAITQQSGIHQWLPNVIKRHPKASAKDMENLFALMETSDIQIQRTMEFLNEGLKKGLTNPRVSVIGVPDQFYKLLEGEGKESPFYESYNNLENFEGDEIDAYNKRAMDIIEGEIKPAYKDMLTFLENEYIPGSRESIGLSELPDGVSKYQSQIRYYTTTDMTAAEIHQLGLSEVKRINTEMEKLKDETGFNGSLKEFNEFLRTDKQFFHKTREELLTEYRDICKRADPELVRLFGKLPRLPYGVIPVPEYLEKHYTTARYERGSATMGIPGYFLANTYDLSSRPKWEMVALSLHEAVPGHHLQIALEQEIEDQPEFKKFIDYTVYIEGWGLYAESLGEEMGMYNDPYSKYGQLTYEMWRAIRLVVDAGMHALGWTREDAINYFFENTAKSRKDIEVEVDRYIGWPGQALAYKIGELKFKELREKSKEKLGEQFDIREFHDLVLSRGSVPLSTLEKMVDEWIAGKAENKDI